MPFLVRAIKRPGSIGYQLYSGKIVRYEWEEVESLSEWDMLSGRIEWKEVEPDKPAEKAQEPERKEETKPKKQK